MKANNILELIGQTPLVRINKILGNDAEIWLKLEKQNPGGSIKDRIALAMIEDAEKTGLLKKGGIIVEPTSGNTGIGLALVSAVKGYELILVMPESMSIERRKLAMAYGAKIELSAASKGMSGAIALAKEIQQQKKAFMPMQFENMINPQTHSQTTALEIIDNFPEGLDYMITGVGTGGHISGVAKVLKNKWPKIKVFAVEPKESSVLSGEKPGPHVIQGIGAGFVPKTLDINILDGIIRISGEEAYLYAQKAAKEEGLLIGISSGASLAAIATKANEIKGKKILSFAYDTGERYLSIENFIG